MRRYIYPLIILIVLSENLFAQDGLYSQYIFNPRLINPSFTNRYIDFQQQAVIKSGDNLIKIQNLDYNNTAWISTVIPIKINYNNGQDFASSTFGLVIFNNNYKGTNINGLNASINKVFLIKKTFQLSIGTALGIKVFKNEKVKDFLVDNQMGIFFNSNKLNLGLSGVNLFSKDNSSKLFTYFTYTFPKIFKINITPILLHQINTNGNQVDFNLKFSYFKYGLIWKTGFGYLSNNSYQALFGVKNHSWDVGFAINFNNNLSNQIFISYELFRRGCRLPEYF